ncbi:MAG: PaaI family thioesterase [bacterium]
MQRAFQDEFVGNYCFGCGSLNQRGLRIKSYWAGDEAVCAWRPDPVHMAGPQGILNGGIIATIIDCHSICTAIADAYRREGRPLDSEPLIWYVTGSLQVSYLRPTPIDTEVTLRARVKERGEKKSVVVCSLSARGEECARGEILAVRVPAAWRETR